jgi:2-oxoglutarate/2-oxoacid ferredoxin oxidoreductase subunit beta
LIDEERLEQPPREPALPVVVRHSTAEIRARLRSPKTLWCPGCTNGIALRALIDAILSLELDPDKVAVIAGIGCSGRITAYLEYSTVHCTHGRALVVATGAKVADPSLHAIVVMGDGDCAAIGGNHLIHAARRNVDLTALVFNNSIYGMTGGQAGPTTHEGDLSKTSPFGNPEPAFDICELARAAGATFVARGTAYNYMKLVQVIAAGIVHKGFSFVEIMSACPTFYGRMNTGADPVQMLAAQRSQGVPVARFHAGQAALRDRYPVGVLHHAERVEYIEAYQELRRRAQGG